MNTISHSIVQKRDKVYLDFLRIIAIFFVVYNHTPGFYFLPYSDCGEIGYWGLLILEQVVKMAVPLFLMVTGALLLHREESIKDLLCKRISRFALAIIIIAFVQYMFSFYREAETCAMGFSISRALFHGLRCFGASWFLFAYMGILLMLPVLRAIAKALPSHTFLYIFGIQIVFCCILPLGEMIATEKCVGSHAFLYWLPFHAKGETLPYSAGYCAFYVLMGYYLEHRVPLTLWHKRRYILIGIASLIVGAICIWVANLLSGQQTIHESVIFLTAFLPFPCAVVYMSLKSACINRQFKPLARKIIASLGGAVFTVMCIENLFRIQWFGIYKDLLPEIGRVPAALVFSAAVYGSALIVGLIVKRIPYLNRIF